MKPVWPIVFIFLTINSNGQKTVKELLYGGFQEHGKKAVHMYSQAIQLDTTSAEAYWRRGDEYHRLKKYRLAMKDLNKSLYLDSGFSYGQVISDRAQTFEMMHNYADAIDDFTKAINYALNNDTAHQSVEQYYYFRARTKLKYYDTASAMVDLDSAIYFWQSYHFARKLRARINTIRGNYKKAMADYNYMLFRENGAIDFPRDKQSAADYYYRGLAKKNSGDPTYDWDLEIAKRLRVRL
jgi:tetratricopeptide (TPR) repeat protein